MTQEELRELYKERLQREKQGWPSKPISTRIFYHSLRMVE